MSTPQNARRDIIQDLEVFRRRKRAVQHKLTDHLELQRERRHLVAIPVNPRTLKQALDASEKNSRIIEVDAKAKAGFYFDPQIFEDIAEKMLSKLWNINFD